MTRRLTLCLGVSIAVSAQNVNQHAAILQDFEKRVADYRKLHQDMEAKLPPLKPTDSPEMILNHEKALAQAIRQARQPAKQGDIFTPEIAPEFRRLLRIAKQGKAAERVEKSLKNAEPVHAPYKINDPYPAGVPLQSTPPTLLLNLPELPKELEYRILNHDLILRDAKANLVVDFIPNVIP